MRPTKETSDDYVSSTKSVNRTRTCHAYLCTSLLCDWELSACNHHLTTHRLTVCIGVDKVQDYERADAGLVQYWAQYWPDSNDLPDGQVDSVHLTNEDDSDGLIQRGAVHVHRGTDRKHKPRHSLIQTEVLLQTTKRHRQRRSTTIKHTPHTFTSRLIS